MQKIILIPTPIELRYCASVLENVAGYNKFGLNGYLTKCKNTELFLICCGLKKNKIEKNIDVIVKNFSPEKIYLFGACGALTSDIKLGELLRLRNVSSLYGYEQSLSKIDSLSCFVQSISMSESDTIVEKKQNDIREVFGVSIRKMIESERTKKMLNDVYGFEVVDFESYHIAEYLRQNNIHLEIYRSPTDYASEDAYEKFYINAEQLLPKAFRLMVERIK